MSTQETINELLADPALSTWFKTSLKSALERDAVDALNDALLLAQVLLNRTNTMLDLPHKKLVAVNPGEA